MSSSFHVDPENLSRASKKIVESLDSVKNMDLGSVPGSADTYGTGGVYEEFALFCKTWQIACGMLARQALLAGQALTVVAHRYTMADATGEQNMSQLRADFPDITAEGGQ